MRASRANSGPICLLLLWLFVAVLSPVKAEPDRSEPVWFHNVEGLQLTETEAAGLFDQIRAFALGIRPKALAPASLPNRLRQDAAPRIVFITVREPHRAASVSLGLGYGLTAAIEDSLARIHLSGNTDSWIRLDIVRSSFVTANPGASLTEGRLGVAFHPRTRIALLYDEFKARGLLTRGRADAAKINAYAKYHRRISEALTPAQMINRYRFSTSAWISHGSTMYPLDLRRSQAQAPEPALISSAVNAALRFLENHMDLRGQFGSSFRGNSWHPDGNLIRVAHLPTMQQVASLTRSRHLHTASNFLVGRVPDLTEPCKTIRHPNVPGRCVVGWAQTYPTHSALAAMALLNSNLDSAPSISMDLGEWLVHLQNTSGEFEFVSREFPRGETLPGSDPSFQGWATLALLKLYRQLPQDRWLSAADRSIRFYLEQQAITSRSRFEPDLAMLQSIQILEQIYPKQQHRQFMLDVADTITHSQLAHEDPELHGSFHLQAGRYSTAQVARSLLVTYPFVRNSGEARLFSTVEHALHNAAAQVVQRQLTPGSALYLWKPEAHLGAFGDTEESPEQLLSATLEDLLFLLEYRAVL